MLGLQRYLDLFTDDRNEFRPKAFTTRKKIIIELIQLWQISRKVPRIIDLETVLTWTKRWRGLMNPSGVRRFVFCVICVFCMRTLTVQVLSLQ